MGGAVRIEMPTRIIQMISNQRDNEFFFLVRMYFMCARAIVSFANVKREEMRRSNPEKKANSIIYRRGGVAWRMLFMEMTKF